MVEVLLANVFMAASVVSFVGIMSILYSAIKDHRLGNAPDPTMRMEYAQSLVLVSCGLISIFLPVSLLVQSCVMAVLLSLFLLEDFLRTGEIKNPYHPLLTLVSGVLGPIYPIFFELAFVARMYYIPPNFEFGWRETGVAYPRSHRVVDLLTNWLPSFVTLAVMAAALIMTVVSIVAGSPNIWAIAISSLAFVFVLRDRGWLSESVNYSIQYVFASSLQLRTFKGLGLGTAWLPLVRLANRFGDAVRSLVKMTGNAVFHLSQSRWLQGSFVGDFLKGTSLYFADDILAYGDSVVHSKHHLEKTYTQRLLRAMDQPDKYQITKGLMMGNKYTFSVAEDSMSLRQYYNETREELARVLDDNLQVQVEPSVGPSFLADKVRLLTELGAVVERVNRRDNFNGFSSPEKIERAIVTLVKEALRLIQDGDEDKGYELLAKVAAEKETCAAGMFAYLSGLAARLQNPGYLNDLEGYKLSKQQITYQDIIAGNVHDYYTYGASAGMAMIFGVNSDLSKTYAAQINDVHKMNMFCAQFSREYYTTQTHAALLDKSVMLDPSFHYMFNYLSFLPKYEYNTNSVQDYLNAVEQDSRTALLQEADAKLDGPELLQVVKRLLELKTQIDFYPIDNSRYRQLRNYCYILKEEYKALCDLVGCFWNEDGAREMFEKYIHQWHLNEIQENVANGHYDDRDKTDQAKYFLLRYGKCGNQDVFSDAVLTEKLLDIGYLARKEEIEAPGIKLYLKQCFYNLVSGFPWLLGAVYRMIKNFTNIALGVAFVPIQAASLVVDKGVKAVRSKQKTSLEVRPFVGIVTPQVE